SEYRVLPICLDWLEGADQAALHKLLTCRAGGGFHLAGLLAHALFSSIVSRFVVGVCGLGGGRNTAAASTQSSQVLHHSSTPTSIHQKHAVPPVPVPVQLPLPIK
ncbi:hypothetical protein ILYODFUR_034185, partial [Ilyodon furcidens]